jgi:hypothetical protein
MQTLTPGPQHGKLALLTGEWTGDEQIFPNPWGPAGPARGRWSFNLDPSGFNLIHRFNEQRLSGYSFHAHGVLTVDPATEEIIWFWFDSYGFPPLSPARGKWSGTTLTLEKQTPRGVSRSIFDLRSDQFLYSVHSRQTDQADFFPVMEGTFVRQR